MHNLYLLTRKNWHDVCHRVDLQKGLFFAKLIKEEKQWGTVDRELAYQGSFFAEPFANTVASIIDEASVTKELWLMNNSTCCSRTFRLYLTESGSLKGFNIQLKPKLPFSSQSSLITEASATTEVSLLTQGSEKTEPWNKSNLLNTAYSASSSFII